MKITPIKAIIGFFSLAVLVQLAFFLPADAQMSLQSLWKLKSGILQPNNPSWPVSIGDLTIGSISEGDMTISNNLTVTGTTTLATTTASMINGTIYVDGVHYPQTGAGIQSAIDALGDAGGTVFLPCSNRTATTTYLLTTYISIQKSNVTLDADGHCANLKVGDEQNLEAIRVGDAVTPLFNIHLRNFSIDGNKDNQSVQPSGTDTRQLIRFRSDNQTSFYSVVENLYLFNGAQDGLSCESHRYCIFTKNRIENMDGFGIWIESDSRVIVTKNFTRNNVGTGIKAFGSALLDISGNVSERDAGGGIALQQIEHASIIGNIVLQAGYNASSSAAILLSSVTSTTVIGNSIDQSYGDGLVLYNSHFNSIKGNSFADGSQLTDNTYSDIRFAATGSARNSNNLFEGNTFQANAAKKVNYNIDEDQTGHTYNQFIGNQFSSGSSGVENITGSTNLFLTTDTGKVGVATTTPLANLSIEHNSGDIAFVVGSSTKTDFIIDAKGYIGINDVSPDALFDIDNSTTNNALAILQTGTIGTTVTTDGAFFINNTSNSGYGFNLYSNMGSGANAPLASIKSDNTGFDHPPLIVTRDGNSAGTKSTALRIAMATGQSDNAVGLDFYNDNDGYAMSFIGSLPGGGFDIPKFFISTADGSHTMQDRITIDKDGNVGIASSTTGFDLAVGNSGMNSGDTAFTNTSNSQLKENISDFQFPASYLNMFSEVKVKNFKYKDDYAEANNLSTDMRVGLMADDVNPLVGKSKDLMTLSGDDKMNAMWEAIRQVIAKIFGLEEKDKQHDQQIQDLQKRIELLEKEVQELKELLTVCKL